MDTLFAVVNYTFFCYTVAFPQTIPCERSLAAKLHRYRCLEKVRKKEIFIRIHVAALQFPGAKLGIKKLIHYNGT